MLFRSPVFWDALVRAAADEEIPLNALIARIDADRITERDLPNLASAIRVWLLASSRGGRPSGARST